MKGIEKLTAGICSGLSRRYGTAVVIQNYPDSCRSRAGSRQARHWCSRKDAGRESEGISMAVPLLIALKTIAEIGAAVQAVNGAYNFLKTK